MDTVSSVCVILLYSNTMDDTVITAMYSLKFNIERHFIGFICMGCGQVYLVMKVVGEMYFMQIDLCMTNLHLR